MVTHQPKDGQPPEGSILQTRNLAQRPNSQNRWKMMEFDTEELILVIALFHVLDYLDQFKAIKENPLRQVGHLDPLRAPSHLRLSQKPKFVVFFWSPPLSKENGKKLHKLKVNVSMKTAWGQYLVCVVVINCFISTFGWFTKMVEIADAEITLGGSNARILISLLMLLLTFYSFFSQDISSRLQLLFGNMGTIFSCF